MRMSNVLRTAGSRLVMALTLLATAGLVVPVPASAGSLPGMSSAADPARRIAPGLQARLQAQPGARFPVIIQMQASPTAAGKAQAAANAVSRLRQHGQAISSLGIIGGAAGVLPAAAIRALANDPAVAYIFEDVPVRRRDGVSSGNLKTAYPFAVGATQAWQGGATGQGVTVAVLDSGIVHDPDLTQPTGVSRILADVNFADPLGTNPDPGGHGTHVAGTIAGNGTRSNGEFIGIAPNASLVNVRVLNGSGAGSASSVIAGIQWVVNHKDQYNIRVLNLSLGVVPSATGIYQQDPIAAAVEIAWLRGIVVVAAAGNGGAGSIDSPGWDPYVITVGASDDQGTPSTVDDVLPTFSGWAALATGAKPDLVAPGRRIVSIRVPGSTLDTLMPDHVVLASNGASYFRLTGTSMATAVVSGAVALLLQRQPGLTPAQVKAAMTGSTQVFGQGSGVGLPNGVAAGAGLLNTVAALYTSLRSPERGLRPADGAARALYNVVYGQPLAWKDPNYLGLSWSDSTWGTLQWNNLVWDNLIWDTFNWSNLIWDNLIWDNLVWDSVSWSNLGWDGTSSTDPLLD